MQQVATIEPLDIHGDVEDWVERLESFTSIQPAVIGEQDPTKKEAIKKSYLISFMGQEAYSVVKATLAPKLPKDWTLTEERACVIALAPTHSAVAEAYKLSQIK